MIGTGRDLVVPPLAHCALLELLQLLSPTCAVRSSLAVSARSRWALHIDCRLRSAAFGRPQMLGVSSWLRGIKE